MAQMLIELPAEIENGLHELSQRSGRPESELLREALERYLWEQKTGLPMPRSIGMGDNADFQAANIDDWLERNWRPS